MKDDEAIQLWRAIVLELKAEMGRQDMSSRALARLVEANAQYITSRLNGGNPRTGKPVILDVRDLSMLARALGLSEIELIERAERSLANERRPNGSTRSPARVAKLQEIRDRQKQSKVRDS